MTYSTRIAGTGSYLPRKTLSNQDFESYLETSDEWIRERTGISQRHIAAEGEATSDMALVASQRALEAAGLKARDVEAIIFATVTPDQVMPNTACMLQVRLGCGSVMALDISAACSGFLYALSIADQYIRTGMYTNILVVGAETLSRIIDYQDRTTCILFGDGAGAAVVTRATEGQTSKIFSSHLHANGELGSLLTLPAGGSRIPLSQDALDKKLHFVQMNGREIFKAAVRALRDRCTNALNASQMSLGDIHWFVVHQANSRIIEAVGQTLDIPRERLLMNVGVTGNTSSASIPILFDQAVRENKIRRGENVMLAAFGGGLTSASVLLRY